MKEENRRIAKNTFIVYTRLAITTLLGLISSRFVLKALGASDFGLYNVVGSVVVIFSFLSSALYGTTTRFINYEQGKENGDTNRIFNISLCIHIAFALVSLVLLETAGIIYIDNFLNVATGKENDAMFVFQVSTIIACISIVGIPFNSLFIAHEKFIVIAFVDILSAIIKFLLIVILLYYPGNSLRFYSIGMALVILLSNLVYVIGSVNKWPSIVKFRLIREKNAYKEILVFNNYSLLGAASLIVRNQGSNILINYFFGTVVNAAYSIAFTVQSYITSFVGNFDTASAPQITQSFSHGDKGQAFFLTTITCKVCVLLTLCMLFPIIAEMEYILFLWLGEDIPQGTVTFCSCTLLIALISSTSGGLVQLINSTGRLKWFTLEYTILYVFALLFSFVLYRIGYPPYSVILLYFIADTISRVIQLYLLHKIINFPVVYFFKEAYLRPMGVLLCGTLYIFLDRCFSLVESCIVNIFVTLFYMVIIILFVGLNKNERSIVFSKLNGFLIRKKYDVR